MTAQAGNTHRYNTIGTWQALAFDFRSRLFPEYAHFLRFDFDKHRGVTCADARMRTRGVGACARLFARRTLAEMTTMRRTLCMMTVGWDATQSGALRWFGALLAAARHRQDGPATSALDLGGQRAGVTGPAVADGGAFVQTAR